MNTNVSIDIVGAGISGLATGLMLDSVGVHNWELTEASDRVGGRFRTTLVGDTEELAEMGPMRLPYKVTHKSDNSTHECTDHQMTFQLAALLNEMNNNDPNLTIDFIPWIQHHPNELIALGTGRHPDGRIPTRAEIAANSSLGALPVMTSAEFNNTKTEMNKILKNETLLREIQADVWNVHKRVMDEGYDDWSEQSLMRNRLQADENVTDAIRTATDYDVFWDEMVHNSNLGLDGSPDSLGETEWKCVDKGFNRISDACIPHVSSRLILNRKIHKLESFDGLDGRTRTRLSWYPSTKNRTFESKEYDYTIMAVPFTMTRFMDLPQSSSVLGRAISEAGLLFKSACKVSLLFSETSWEKSERPIFGGYSRPEDKAAGALYYPVYGLNQSRPGLITHYRGGDWSDRFASFTEEEHVGLVLDLITSLHGEEAWISDCGRIKVYRSPPLAALRRSASSELIRKASEKQSIMSEPKSVAIVGAVALSKRDYRVTVFDRYRYDETHYEPDLNGNTQAASVDHNKIFRASYGSKLHYQRLAFESRAAWEKINEKRHQDGDEPDQSELFSGSGMLRVQPTAELDPLERETLSNFERDGLRDTQFVKSDPIDRARAAERGWERKLLDFEIPQASPAQTYEAVLDSTAGFTKCSEACAYFYKLALQQGVEFHFGSEKGAFDSIVEEIDSPSHLKKAVGVKTKDGVLHKADVVAICGSVVTFKVDKNDAKLWDKYSPERFPVITWRSAPRNPSGKDTGSVYVFPRTADGLIKIGFRGIKFTNFQHAPSEAGFTQDGQWSVPLPPADCSIVPDPAKEAIRKFVSIFLPEFADKDFNSTKLCWYTDSLDNSFVIDHVPTYSQGSVFVATGGSGHGAKFLPVLGEHAADILIHGDQSTSFMRQHWRWRDNIRRGNGLEEGPDGPRNIGGSKEA
ncbi:hypothetical protein COL516b_005850 [Colletotrichum fioriniae]|nr:uncharacterized protein COL516b_005850 [Colletotrichum fioriniae]KAJ0304495.1 hypothetical protein COL516b_005850 [Colletotrichum fioriniae]